MAPKGKQQRSRKRNTQSQNHHKQHANNGANIRDTPTASSNASSLQETSQPSGGVTFHHHAVTSNQHQPHASEHATLRYVTRPWGHDAVDLNTNGSAAATTATPLERWQNESTNDQPWHILESVYLYDEQKSNGQPQDGYISIDGYEGLYGVTDDVSSLLCNASDDGRA